MARTAPAVALLTIPLLAAGCVQPAGGADPEGGAASPAPAASAPSGVAERGERGGPRGAELAVDGVRTHAVANDTVELATSSLSGDSGEAGRSTTVEWTPRFTVAFASARRDGDDLAFRARAEYLHDEGSYVVHSQDFTVLVPNGADGGAEGGFAAAFDAYTAGTAEELATLTPDEPTAEFTVTIAGVPEEDAGERYADGTSGRYVQYETPEEVWGHTTAPPQDYVPGRLCYIEGDTWHDVPLFEYTDVPCG
jgi:hypothetical protein